MSDSLFNFSILNILIIDDNDFVRFMIEKHLLKFGCRKIYQAKDGYSGLDIFKQEKPDIVICDINMKPADGFKFLTAVRNMSGPIREVPVIFLTSHADEAFVKRAVEMKIDSYLLKPVMPSFLKIHIVKALSQKMLA